MRSGSIMRVGAAVQFSNVHVGGVAVGLLLGTYALAGLPPDLPLLVLAFCGTFGVYQLEHGSGLAPEDAFNQPARLAWRHRHRRYVRRSTGLVVVLGVLMVPLLRPATLLAGGVLGLWSLAYMLPVLPQRRRLKAVWFLKPLTIAGAWAAGAVVMPAVEAGHPLTGGLVALCVYRFLIVLPNALLADWPDRGGDAHAGLRTAATEWPAATLRRLAVGVLLLATGGGLAAVWCFDAPALLYVDLAGCVVMLGLVGRVSTWESRRHLFVMDLLVAWPFVTALAAWATPL